MEPNALKLDEFLSVVEEIRREDREGVAWVLLNVPNEESSAPELVSGAGKLEDMVGACIDTNLSLGYIRIQPADEFSVRFKYMCLCWSGEDAPRMLRSNAPYFKTKLVDALGGKFHVDVLASTKEELTEETVLALIKKASGADYDSGGGDQTTEGVAVAPKRFSKPAPRGGRRLHK